MTPQGVLFWRGYLVPLFGDTKRKATHFWVSNLKQGSWFAQVTPCALPCIAAVPCGFPQRAHRNKQPKMAAAEGGRGGGGQKLLHFLRLGAFWRFSRKRSAGKIGEAIARPLPKRRKTMPGLCLGYAWAMPGLCLGYAWAMPGLCLGHAWAMPGLCLGYAWANAWAAPGLCLGCMPGLCLGYAWAVPGLCLGYAWAVPGLCLGCAWAVPALCLG